MKNYMTSWETTWTVENPACQQTTLCDIHIAIKYYWQIFMCKCTDPLPLKI